MLTAFTAADVDTDSLADGVTLTLLTAAGFDVILTSRDTVGVSTLQQIISQPLPSNITVISVIIKAVHLLPNCFTFQQFYTS